MRTEWGQPTSDDDRDPDPIEREHEGLMLRDREAGPLDPFDWGVPETIVWIATRDEAAVRGAAGYLADEGRHRPSGFIAPGLRLQDGGRTRIESLLRTLLPLDVADHHADCTLFLGEGTCTCDHLGRLRYCRCPDHLSSRTSTCRCVAIAIDSFLLAFRHVLIVSGRKDDEQGYDDVPPPRRIHASFSFSGMGGFRLLPAYADLRLSVKEIKSIWPAIVGDWPADESDAESDENEEGRDDLLKKVATLRRFVERAREGKTKFLKRDEVRLIFETPGGGCGKATSIDKWIRPFHKQLFDDDVFMPAAVPGVIEAVDAELEEGRQRRLAAERKRVRKAGFRI